MKCFYCNNPANANLPKCVCGYPLAGTAEEKEIFLETKKIVLKNEVEQSRRHLRIARYIIFGVAALALFQTVQLYGNSHFGGIWTVLALLSVVFLALGVFFHRSPLLSCSAALVLGFFIFSISLVSLLVMVFLAIGLYFAFEARKAVKTQERLNALLESL